MVAQKDRGFDESPAKRHGAWSSNGRSARDESCLERKVKAYSADRARTSQ